MSCAGAGLLNNMMLTQLAFASDCADSSTFSKMKSCFLLLLGRELIHCFPPRFPFLVADIGGAWSWIKLSLRKIAASLLCLIVTSFPTCCSLMQPV